MVRPRTTASPHSRIGEDRAKSCIALSRVSYTSCRTCTAHRGSCQFETCPTNGETWYRTAFEVLSRARALEASGREIIHLEIGEPDFDSPANVVASGVRALQAGFTHYSPAAGIPELRHAVAEYVSKTRGISVTQTVSW